MSGAAWLDEDELRIGLGCMRLVGDGADETAAAATIAAAADAGITVFDTAHAYGPDPDGAGHNERLLAASLRACGYGGRARIVTKGGMTRPGGAWAPDGRARRILADCHASLAALDGLPIDLYLLHAPDPRTPWATSVRALARLLDEGLVRRIGLANVTRDQLDEALSLAPISAVQVSLSRADDAALRGGLVAHCAAVGIALMAHSPLGGPRRSLRLAGDPALAAAARAQDAAPAEVALAWLLDLSPTVVAIPGARRPETARSAASAARLTLHDATRAALGGIAVPAPRPPASGPAAAGEVVLVMGIPAAGKTSVANRLAAAGGVRLNRDERGGALRGLVTELDAQLSAGVRRAVLDNTYLTRAARSDVVRTAAAHGLPCRCVWVATPLEQAQVNAVQRLLDRFGSLPSPEELRELARRHPGVLLPTAQMRAVRALERPALEEGFAAVETAAFERMPPAEGVGGGVMVAAAAAADPIWLERVEPAYGGAPHLVFDWRPAGDAEPVQELAAALSAATGAPVDVAICPHSGGPPACWCRPPLPGLPLAFAHRHRLAAARSTLVGTRPAHRAVAAAIGAHYLDAGGGSGGAS